MNKINEQINNKCRTCLNTPKVLQSLSKMAMDETKQKTYAEMLKEVTNINIVNDKYDALPQVICGCCTRKLKAAHAFVQQAQEANEKLWSLLQGKNDGDKQLDCLQESQIDFQSCLEIKMEDNEITANEKEELLKHRPLKTEEAEEDAKLVMDKTKDNEKEKHDSLESPKDSLDLKSSDQNQNMSDCEDFTNIAQTVLSESDKDYHDNDSNPSNNSDWQEDLKTSKKAKSKKKKILPKLRKRKGHPDPLDNEETIKDEMLPTRCEDCDKVFPNARLLNIHRRGTHVPEELKIQCPHCEAKFSRRHNMYVHMRVIHKEENLEEYQLQPKKLPKEHACQECTRSYTNKYKLLAHIKSRHNPEITPATEEKLVVEKELKPRKRFLCTLCGLTFDSQSNLNIHYRRHTGEKPFKCDYCDRAYHRLYDVQVHLRSHTGEKPYQCTICEKAFRRSNKLKIHMRTHTNERPYKCTQCEKAFKQSKDLNIHKRTHTGERPYKCGVCQSTFTQSNSLRLHQTKQKHFVMNNSEEDTPQAMYHQQTLNVVVENKTN